MTDPNEPNKPNEQPSRRPASAGGSSRDQASRRQDDNTFASDMFAGMAEHLASNDEEQAHILDAMQRRFERIAARTEEARRQVPSEAEAAIANRADEPPAPVSAADADRSAPAADLQAWNADTAEALTRHLEAEGYAASSAVDGQHLALEVSDSARPAASARTEESEDTGVETPVVASLSVAAAEASLESEPVLPVASDTSFDAGAAGPAPEMHGTAPPATEPSATETPAAEPAVAESAIAGVSPAEAWFAERFEALAERLDRMTGGDIPDASLAVLLERLDGLEARLDATAESATAAAGPNGSLHEIELCIAELAAQLETTNAHVGRISEIEQQIAAFTRGLAGDGDAAPLFDPAAVADLVADRLAARPMPDRANAATYGEIEQAGIGELTAMLKDFMNERRTEGEHANAVLDTMQQTIIRLLDRMDVLESGQDPYVGPHQGSQSLASASWAQSAPEPTSDTAADDDLFADVAPPAAFGRKPAPSPDSEPTGSPAAADASDIGEEAGSRERLERAIGELESAAEAATDPGRATGRLRARHPGDAPEPAAAPPVGARPRRATRKPIDPVADRNRFAEAARAAAASANQRSRAADTDDVLLAGSAPTGAPFRPERPAGAKSMFGSVRTRLLVAALAVLVVGLGATKLVSSFSAGTGGSGAGAKPAAVEQNSSAIDAVRPATVADVRTGAIGNDPAPAAPAIRQADPSGVGSLAQPAAVNPSEVFTGVVTGQQTAGASRLALPNVMVGPLSLRLAAAGGDASAQFEVAARFAEGRGVEQDFKEAATWYQRSAASSFALSQYRLATLYERGLGVEKDIQRARVWYERAAAQGNVKAMHNLAVIAAGNTAGKPDYIKAAQWFTAAAEHGLGDSQFNLAILYQHGLGVAKDEARAYRWFSLAAFSGDREAQKRKAEVRAALEPAKVAELDSAVAEWSRRPAEKLANDPHAAGQHWQRSSS